MNSAQQLNRNARSSMYRLLASIYARELTEENIIGFREGAGLKLLEALESVTVYAPLAAYLKNYFNKIEDPQKAALDLAESYAWNFHGVAGPHASPLYASIYLSKTGSTHQKIESELHNILKEHGLSSVNFEKEPCDHLAIILEFVSWLDEQEGTNEQQAEWGKTQKNIIDNFLLNWLSKFVTQCKHGDRFGFYAAVAKETLTLVEADFK